MGGKGSGGYRKGSEKNLEKARANNPLLTPQVADRQRNVDVLAYLAELAELPKIDPNDAEQVERRAAEWFELLAKYGMRPQVNAWAACLGLDRRRLWEIVSGNERGERVTREARDCIAKIYQFIAIFNENALLETQGNPAGLIFLAKNHHAYRDVQERQELHIRAELDALPPAEIAKRYRLQAGIDQGDYSESDAK